MTFHEFEHDVANASDGVVVGQAEWTIARARDVTRENRRRYATEPYIQDAENAAAALAEALTDKLGDQDTRVGEVLMFTASWLAHLVHNGADEADLLNVLGFTGDNLCAAAERDR